MPCSILAVFFISTLIVSMFYFSIAKQTDKNITLFKIDFWYLVDSCGTPMQLLPSRWCFLSIKYLNVFLQLAFGWLIKSIFCHCWNSNELFLDEKWLFCLLLLNRSLLIVLKWTKFGNHTETLKKIPLVGYFHYN